MGEHINQPMDTKPTPLEERQELKGHHTLPKESLKHYLFPQLKRLAHVRKVNQMYRNIKSPTEIRRAIKHVDTTTNLTDHERNVIKERLTKEYHSQKARHKLKYLVSKDKRRR